MKILLASTSSGSRGGGELYLNYLGRALAARGNEVALWASSHPRMDELCTRFAEIGRVLRADYTNTYDRRFRSVASYLDRGSARAAAGSWKKHAPDVVHLNKQNLEDGLDLVRAAGECGIPSVATIHLSQSARYLGAHIAGVRDFVSRRALNAYAGPLVTVIEQRRRDLCDFLGEQPRIRTIPNGVELFDLTSRNALRDPAIPIGHETAITDPDESRMRQPFDDARGEFEKSDGALLRDHAADGDEQQRIVIDLKLRPLRVADRIPRREVEQLDAVRDGVDARLLAEEVAQVAPPLLNHRDQRSRVRVERAA